MSAGFLLQTRLVCAHLRSFWPASGYAFANLTAGAHASVSHARVSLRSARDSDATVSQAPTLFSWKKTR
jgi:lipid-binding SYLF domain-containing protein